MGGNGVLSPDHSEMEQIDGQKKKASEGNGGLFNNAQGFGLRR